MNCLWIHLHQTTLYRRLICKVSFVITFPFYLIIWPISINIRLNVAICIITTIKYFKLSFLCKISQTILLIFNSCLNYYYRKSPIHLRQVLSLQKYQWNNATSVSNGMFILFFHLRLHAWLMHLLRITHLLVMHGICLNWSELKPYCRGFNARLGLTDFFQHSLAKSAIYTYCHCSEMTDHHAENGQSISCVTHNFSMGTLTTSVTVWLNAALNVSNVNFLVI